VRRYPEIDRAEWFPLAEARHKLVSGQVPILTTLAHVLRVR
jgi:predicted NUDIX family NTP pyrophosphohydrolase